MCCAESGALPAKDFALSEIGGENATVTDGRSEGKRYRLKQIESI
jgi:hypothetical protein